MNYEEIVEKIADEAKYDTKFGRFKKGEVYTNDLAAVKLSDGYETACKLFDLDFKVSHLWNQIAHIKAEVNDRIYHTENKKTMFNLSDIFYVCERLSKALSFIRNGYDYRKDPYYGSDLSKFIDFSKISDTELEVYAPTMIATLQAKIDKLSSEISKIIDENKLSRETLAESENDRIWYFEEQGLTEDVEGGSLCGRNLQRTNAPSRLYVLADWAEEISDTMSRAGKKTAPVGTQPGDENN